MRRLETKAAAPSQRRDPGEWASRAVAGGSPVIRLEDDPDARKATQYHADHTENPHELDNLGAGHIPKEQSVKAGRSSQLRPHSILDLLHAFASPTARQTANRQILILGLSSFCRKAKAAAPSQRRNPGEWASRAAAGGSPVIQLEDDPEARKANQYHADHTDNPHRLVNHRAGYSP